LYDNGTMIVESFCDAPVNVGLIFSDPTNELIDIGTQKSIGLEAAENGNRANFEIKPHSYVVLRSISAS
jgi:hypothetical protein